MERVPFDELWQRVIAECAPGHLSVHGPDHWHRVERNARILATQGGVNETVVRLFALFHDSQRLHDGYDQEHGARGAVYACSLRGRAFELSDPDFDLLEHACIWHTDGLHHENPTIGACWDADRLDLGRVGIIPSSQFMSTPLGREIAAFGSVQPWEHLAPPVFRS